MVLITSQPAKITITVINEVKGRNHKEIPSIPRKYSILNRSSQMNFSTNWNASLLESNKKTGASVIRKLIIDKKNARILTLLTEKITCLLARKIIKKPEIIGIHMDKDIHGNEDKIKDKDICYA